MDLIDDKLSFIESDNVDRLQLCCAVDNCSIYLAISSVLDQGGPLNRIYLEKIEIYSRASNLYKRYRITLSTWRGRENKYEDLEVI